MMRSWYLTYGYWQPRVKSEEKGKKGRKKYIRMKTQRRSLGSVTSALEEDMSLEIRPC